MIADKRSPLNRGNITGSDRIAALLPWLAGGVFGTIVAVFLLLGYFALPVLFDSNITLFSPIWRPEQGQYGILAMVVASVMLAILASLIALPLAVGICGLCLFPQYRRIAALLRALMRLMAGVPTVVYGIAAVFLLVPWLRDTLHYGSGFCLLAAILMVVILILPVMIMLLDSHCRVLMQQLYPTASALGMTSSQIILHLILPSSRPVLAASTLLGLSRAIGDTLLPLMLAGNAPQLSANLLDSMRTLTAHIALVLATDSHSAEYNSLFAAGLLLLSVSTVTTILIRTITTRSGARSPQS